MPQTAKHTDPMRRQTESVVTTNIQIRSVYLAGPDVFRPDIARIKQEKRDLCAAVGLFPLDPCDNDNVESSKAIYLANIAMVDRADLVIANLTPFRGAEPDSGTVFEAARAIAFGKPVFGYLNPPLPENLYARVAMLYGPLSQDEHQDKEQALQPCVRDRDGNAVENWGHPLNLMLFHGLAGLSMSFEAALQLAVGWKQLPSAALGTR